MIEVRCERAEEDQHHNPNCFEKAPRGIDVERFEAGDECYAYDASER